MIFLLWQLLQHHDAMLSTGVLSLTNLSYFPRARVVQQQSSPLIRKRYCKLHTTSAAPWKSNLCPDSFGPTCLGFRAKWAWHIAGACKLFLHLLSKAVYIFDWFVFEGEGLVHKLLFGSSPTSSLTVLSLHTFPMWKAGSNPLFYQHFSAQRVFCWELLPALFSCKRVGKESSWQDDSRAPRLSSDINKYLLFGI